MSSQSKRSTCSDASVDEPVAQLAVHEQALDHHAEVLGIAAVEAQPDTLTRRHDLAQPAGVGDDAGAAGGHRLQRDQPEGLIDRRDHAQIGDPVQRVQRVVADPAEEPPMLGRKPQAARACAFSSCSCVPLPATTKRTFPT